MRRKCALLVLLVLLMLTLPAGAALVTFTGNVDADFAGVPDAVSRTDTVGDDKGPGGCDDEPLGVNSFVDPPGVPIPSSGFNVERLVTAYDCTTDILYIGLDVCDGKTAWDADGNGNILTKNPSILGPPGVQPQLKGLFSDETSEDYQVEIDVNNDGSTDLRILVRSDNGGTTVTTSTPVSPAGVTVSNTVTGPDVEVMVHGLRAAFPQPSPGTAILPVRIATRSGATGDLVNEDVTNALYEMPCRACISITKGVSCSETGPFSPSVQALRGATVYFQIQVTNCGTDHLRNVVINDSFTTNGACCAAGSCIPLSINVGNLAPGDTKTYTYPVPTDPAFAGSDVTSDCTNTASVSGIGVLTNINVSAGPVTATVDVVVPSITCSKLLDDDSNFGADPNDNTAPTSHLRLDGGGNAWYQFCVTNTGKVPVDFSVRANANCPAFTDSFLETLDAQIPGTGANLDTLFRSQLQTQFGSNSLPVGQAVCVVVGPVLFDESVLCPFRHEFADEFQACGFATSTQICMPPAGGENVSTEPCTGKVSICPPCIEITKEVSCSPTTNFGPSVTALRGATVYFKVTVTNCGGEDLNDVTVSDAITDLNGALLACTGCTGIPGCIPGTINLGTIAVGDSKSFVCTVPTNPNFSVKDILVDATNTASVTAVSAQSSTVVNDGPVSATVNLLVPGITCLKLADDDGNPDPAQAGDPTAPTTSLNLTDAIMDVEQAWYWFSVTNNGEVPVDFAAGANPNCPSFSDDFLEALDPQIPGTGVDIDALFRNKLLARLGGGLVLQPGETVSLPVGPVSFDETVLCGSRNIFTDHFTACGFATRSDICLPQSGGETVNTGTCQATVTICSPPCIEIMKEVSCSPTEDFGPSVTALRGADVYFRITVKNCGGDNLTDVVITDTLDDAHGALLPCEDCTGTGSIMPGTINVGNLAVGETKVFTCTVPTNGAFTFITADPNDPDATNTVSVVGKSVRTGETVTDGPSSAEVNLLTPAITCDKLIDNDSNFETDPADDTPPTCDLDLTLLPMGTKQVWYKLCVENTGEVEVDFSANSGECPNFTDSFLEEIDPQIPGTGADIDALFRSALTSAFGGEQLPAGEKVCIMVGPVTLDESVLCPSRRILTDQFSACGIATDDGICLPGGGGEIVDTGVCECKVRICPTNICIEKGVACSPAGPFLPEVTALRGSTVYFQVVVTNCGGEVLNNVTLTDTLVEGDGNPLLNCTGCTGIPGCIPGVTNLGSLNPGEARTIVCTFPTNGNFAVPSISPDATNTASVTGVGAVSGTSVSDGPVTAIVNVVMPSITCELLMDDDSNLDADGGDMTPPNNNLNLAVNGPPQIERVWTRLKVYNTGEVDCDFTAGAGDAPMFWCPFLSTPDASIPGTGLDIAQAFRDALQTAYGNHILPPGASVEVRPDDPVILDETMLCPNRTFFVNRFRVSGIAAEDGLCPPPGGGEIVDTGMCQGTITICEPVLFQAYPGDSRGVNVHYMGYLGETGDTISAVPGVFILEPGETWRNFVTAAQVGVDYTLKNVSLVKETPQFIQCADVFRPTVIRQQGTADIRLRWPLMYEAPGTRWTLTIQYGTSFPWDDDGIEGPHVAGYYHEDEWSWKVDATLYSMKLLLQLFHEVPFGLDEVPLISDETLYPLLQQKLDNIIALVEDDKTREAATALGEFEMEVSDACIATSPRTPYPLGPGTGIANSEENPACCKILVDAEHVGIKLELFQQVK